LPSTALPNTPATPGGSQSARIAVWLASAGRSINGFKTMRFEIFGGKGVLLQKKRMSAALIHL